jgi:isoquinoline 1-oxidoreductase subunit alpha
MPRYQLTINGEQRSVEAPEDMPLLWVLRDLVGLTGTKYGCGISQCRACTVHLDGEPVQSCQLAISAVAPGAAITTIEGLAQGDSGELHPVQQAWLDEQVPQCGYCQPGQIMSAVALLRRTPKPTDADIDAGMGGNICRCGTYNRIRAAVHRAAGGGK